MPDALEIQVATNTQRITTLERDMVRLEGDLTTLDQHGTRGVATLAGQVSELAKDLARMELNLERYETAMEAMERRRVAGVKWTILAILGLLTPIYAAIILALIQGRVP